MSCRGRLFWWELRIQRPQDQLLGLELTPKVFELARSAKNISRCGHSGLDPNSEPPHFESKTFLKSIFFSQRIAERNLRSVASPWVKNWESSSLMATGFRQGW